MRAHGLAAHDHLQRLGHPDEARQPLRPAGTGEDAELDLGQPALGAAHRDAVVAAERELEPTAERRAVEGGDNRLRASVVELDHVGERRSLGGLAELGDVGARDERATLPDEHDGLDLGVGEGLRVGVDQPLAHRLAERVDGRIVDGDDSDMATLLEQDDVTHGR